MIFISVNTPIKQKGLGAGETSDLRWVESCADKLAKLLLVILSLLKKYFTC